MNNEPRPCTYLDTMQQALPSLRMRLSELESGKLRQFTQRGAGEEKDVTDERANELRAQIAVYEAVLGTK